MLFKQQVECKSELTSNLFIRVCNVSIRVPHGDIHDQTVVVDDVQKYRVVHVHTPTLYRIIQYYLCLLAQIQSLSVNVT